MIKSAQKGIPGDGTTPVTSSVTTKVIKSSGNNQVLGRTRTDSSYFLRDDYDLTCRVEKLQPYREEEPLSSTGLEQLLPLLCVAHGEGDGVDGVLEPG